MNSVDVHREKKKNEVLSSESKLENAALNSASSLMKLQLLSRIVTFILNQALVRLTSPAVYGTVSIQLELLLNTILFLSREGFRNALLRTDVSSIEKRGNASSITNIYLLPVYFGVPISLSASFAYQSYASDATKQQSHFLPAVALYTLAAILELICEPMHVRSVQSLNSEIRIRAEGSAIIVKSIITVLTLVYDSHSNVSGTLGLLAFALGQLAFSITLLVVYFYEYADSITFLMHRSKTQLSGSNRAPGGSILKYLTSRMSAFFDENLLEVALAMTAQGFVKHVLTEGDKVIISRISPLKDQGGYAVANNYGALIARIFFQPIEESSRLFFSKTFSSVNTDTLDRGALQSALARLGSLLLIYSHFSFLLLSLAPPYLRMVLSVVLPSRYLNTSAPAVLSAWLWYIPVLAVNGVLEAFISSASTSKDLGKQSKWMAGASVLYVIFTITLYHLGGLGDTAVVYANMVNLTSRIIYCVYFISDLIKRSAIHQDDKGRVKRGKGRMGKGKDKGKGSAQARNRSSDDEGEGEKCNRQIKALRLKEVLPPFPVLCMLGGAAVVTRISARMSDIDNLALVAGRDVLRTKACILHLGVGASCGLAVIAVCFLTEKKEMMQFISLLLSRGSKKKVD